VVKETWELEPLTYTPSHLALANNKQLPRKRVGRKIGRNEMCACGSGKKYKFCCWDKERSAFLTYIERN
jgi:uncharacterized protein YecA (UPF0149 family)